MKILFFTDPHNSDKAPEMRKETYTEDIVKKQEQLVSLAKDYDAVICGGDIFHSKKEEKISYKLCNRLLEIYREFPNLYIVVGNHDLGGNEQLFNERPIGLFGKLPNCKLYLEGFDILDDSVILSFLGGGEFFSREDIISKLKKMSKEVSDIRLPSIATVHASIANLAMFDYPFEIIPFKDVNKYFTLFLIGHLHDYQICTNRIACPGSLSRGVLKLDQTLDRKIGFISVDVSDEGISTERRYLSVKPAEDIFRISKRIEEKMSDEEISSFSDLVALMELPKTLNSNQLIRFIFDMDIDDAVKLRAKEILERIE